MTCQRACLFAALVAALGAPAAAQRPGKMEIPVHKSGKVVMQDGTPLPEPVLIEANCGGTFQPVARTDSKGGFNLGGGRGADVDARTGRSAPFGAGGPQTAGAYLGCLLMARLPGYRSSSLRVADAGAFDIGTIILSRPAGVEGTLVSATGLHAPKPAQKSMEKARSALAKQKWDEARQHLEKTVELHPTHAEAWFELGRVYQQAGDLAQARKALERSIACDPKFVRPYLPLAGIFHREQNWQAAADTSAKAIALDPVSFDNAYVMDAIANMRLGKMDAAEKSARKAIEVAPAGPLPEAEYALAVILDSRGDAKGAIEHLRNFLRLAPDSPGAEGVKQRLAELEKAK